MDGWLIIDKPAGITSHDVVAFARRRLKTQKIGHTGTLDPLATGVLVLGVGSATRLIEYIVGCDKEYEAEITFGGRSNTGDSEGEIIPTPNSPVFAREDLEKLLPKYLGKISQIPPQYSAIKIGGKNAYELAREGIEIEMQPREIEIHALKLISFKYPKVDLHIHCGSGTYIRSIARDLGEDLLAGGYLTRLKRMRVGKFNIKQAISLKAISEEKILPLEEGLVFSRLNLTIIEAAKIRNGQKISCRAGEGCEDFLAGFAEGKLLAILEFEKEKHTLKPVKVFLD